MADPTHPADRFCHCPFAQEIATSLFELQALFTPTPMQPALVFLLPNVSDPSRNPTIDIDSNVGQPITVGDVWEAMYEALQIPIVESEWGFVVRDEKLRTTVENAMKKRVGADPMLGMADSRRPKRIDLLGDSTLFRGLERDDEFAKSMLLPSAKALSETWVIKLIA